MPHRLLHLSDIHFGCQDLPAFNAACDYVRASAFDLLVVSGDITQLGAHDEFAAASAWLAAMPGPQLVTPGNHDTPWFGLGERAVSPFGRYERTIGPSRAASFHADGLSVRTTNSARGWQLRINWSKGHVGRAQAREVADHLAASPADAVRILVCHHPLVEAEGEPITSKVRGGRYAARRLTEARVDVVMSGHLHVPFVQALPFGDRRTYAVGAGTLSQRERGVPPSFNVLEIDKGELAVTAMAWDGKDLAPSRRWTVPLRARLECAAAS